MAKIGEKMKNYKISKKLTISYAVVLCLLVIAILVSVFNLVNLGKEVEEFYNGPFTVSASANTINASFEEMQKSTYRSLSNEDMDITNAAIEDARKAAEVIQGELPTIEKNFLGDMTIVENLENELGTLSPMREKVLELASANKNTEAAAYMEENNIPSIHKAQGYLDSLIESANENGEALISNLRSAQTRSVIILLVLGVVSIIVGVLFAKYITRSITEPVSEIENAAANLAQGKLDAVIDYRSEDEMGHLAHSMRNSMRILGEMVHDVSYLMGEMAKGNFNIKTKAEGAYIGEFLPLLLSMREMNSSLSSTLSQINESSDQVAIGSTQMAQNAQGLAEGATEQAGAVQELNATIDDVSNMAEQSAEGTREAYGQVKKSAEKAEEGSKEMERLTKAMERIDATSKEIGNIIAAIEDIASQTNLLSLNASIEAARAGEAGKGFAVVADQIGKLAADSAQSAVNTRGLIEKTLQEIQNGNEIMEKTSQAFEEVIVAMKDFADVAKDTSEKSQEQSNSLKQVREGVEQISSVVQSNSAAAEETSATSEELAAQSDNLKTLVSKFILKKQG